MSKQTIVAVIVGFAYFMQNLDATVVTTALPRMALSFDVNPIGLSLVVTMYIVAVAVFTPASGWASDRFGASTVFQAAMILFTIGSLVCGVSETVPLLMAGRIVQGIGGAMMVPVGRAVMLRTVPKSDWVRVLTYVQLAAQLGFMVGPPLGGFMTTDLSWRWIFLINLPVGVLGLVLARIYIANIRNDDRTPFDWLGFILSGISLSVLMYTIEAIGHRLAGAAIILLCGVVAFGSGAVSVWHFLRHPYPLLHLRLLRIPSFRINMTGGSVFRISWGAMPFLLPLLFQIGLGMTALASGLLTFSTAIGSVVVQFLAAPLYRRFGFRSFLLGNGLICAAFIFGCALISHSTSTVLIYGLLFGWGFFQSLQFNALNTLAYADLDAQQLGVGSSMSQLGQQFSAGIGVAVAAFVLQISLDWRGAQHLGLIDFRTAFIASGILCAASLPSVIGLSRDIGTEVSGHRSRSCRGKGKGEEDVA